MFTSNRSPFLPQALGHESTFMFLFVVRLSQGCVGEFKPYGYSVGVWGAGCRFFFPLGRYSSFSVSYPSSSSWIYYSNLCGGECPPCPRHELMKEKVERYFGKDGRQLVTPHSLGPPPLPCQPHLEAHRPLVVAGLAPARSVTRQLCVSAALSRNIVGRVLSKPLAAWWPSLPGQHS